MHISDGILSLQWNAIWYVIALIFIAFGIREIKQRTSEDPSYMPLLALMGSAIFVIAVWHIPVPVTGSCSHPIGTPMSAIIIGPFATVILSTIALILHIFLAHGGITSLGANTFSMGIVGTFVGLGTFLLFRKVGASIWLSAGFAGFIGSVMTYITTAFELAISLNPDSFFQQWIIYSLGFIPTQLPLAIAEFIFTAAIVKYIVDAKPEIIKRLGGVVNG
ncbi:MAG: energy-coupling factor ABC transporter permease [Methanosarcinales archaeon]|nr:energy-coupling factor ABC transporter permease [Methanosarcinales archaeon]